MNTDVNDRTTMCLITRFLWLVMIVSAAIGNDACASEKSTSGIELIDAADPQRPTRIEYALKIDGSLITPSQNGAAEWNLNSSGKFTFDQRRFPSDATGSLALKAVRRFEVASTESVVGKERKTSVVLPLQAHLIQIYGAESQLIQLSPDVRLTRPQVDLLQIPCDPIVANGLLPARTLNDQHEKWNADAWVVPLLVGVDAVVSQSDRPLTSGASADPPGCVPSQSSTDVDSHARSNRFDSHSRPRHR